MAKWVKDAQDAHAEDSDEDDADLPSHILPLHPPLPSASRPSKPFSSTLAKLFKGLPKRARASHAAVNEEAELMEALANAEEEETPDDGAIEIASDEDYIE